MSQQIDRFLALTRLGRRLADDQRGVAMVITALALIMLIGFLGLATDVVIWEINKRTMQGAADQAALAAATAYRNAGETTALGDSTTAQNAALATAARAGYPPGAIGTAASCAADGSVLGTVVCPYNSSGGSPCSSDGCLIVAVTQTQPRFFTAILPYNWGSFTSTATAVGTCSGCGGGAYAVASTGGDPCVMALDSSGSGVITASGTPTMSLTKCNLYNNSPNTSATIVSGSATIEGCSTTDACGSKAFLAQPDIPSGTIDIPIVTSAAPAPDPYAGLTAPTPASSCISTLPPNPVPSGTYCPGNINNTDVVFADGATIIITGGLSTKGNSSLTGNGVTLYVLGGGSINANSTVSITAPSTGPYAGLAVWFGDSSSVTWNGGNSSLFKGAIYAPTATVKFAGNASSDSTCTRLIAAAITLDGSATASFDNSGCPAVAGPVLTSSGVTGSGTTSGSPILVQ